MISSHQPCPCGQTRPKVLTGAGRSHPTDASSVLDYGECCGRWHQGPAALQAPDAEHLMRSRYSAYVLDLLDYLLQTWAPQTRPDTLTPNEPGLRWLGLTLLEHQRTGLDTATVRFVARFKVGGRAQRLQEISRFERGSDGRWFYVDGDMG